MEQPSSTIYLSGPRNKGKLIGQKASLKPGEVWAIRVRLQLEDRVRDLAPFDLAIDSKLRSCDLVGLRVRDVSYGDRERVDVSGGQTRQAPTPIRRG